ncbi:hypothetical protein CKO28_18610 [Rhodovibrio sodomensis]|uniref:Uncharacterized protein n=1 Tax=Rhodovibrio sodomensis TaxID=1088 RepID=A0ABS1DHV8_9PROT|nr:hypothetical protein [Rhodovibrio sodomensis]
MLAINQNDGSQIGKKGVTGETEKLVAFNRTVDLFHELVAGRDLLPKVDNVGFFKQDARRITVLRSLGGTFLTGLCRFFSRIGFFQVPNLSSARFQALYDSRIRLSVLEFWHARFDILANMSQYFFERERVEFWNINDKFTNLDLRLR